MMEDRLPTVAEIFARLERGELTEYQAAKALEARRQALTAWGEMKKIAGALKLIPASRHTEAQG